MRSITIAVLIFAFFCLFSEIQAQPLDAPRPIEARPTVFLEEMTWMEVRDAVASGKQTVIVPTGGVEQNGPYLALGKHNYIIEETSKRIAERLQTALVSPVVKFVPEGDIQPPSGHMVYPGTISVEEATFKRLVGDICRSLRAHGFRQIVLLGDSGGNQAPLRQIAADFTDRWVGENVKVIFVPEYYNYPEITSWLEKRGYLQQQNDGLHDDLAFTAQLMAINPELVRAEQRKRAGNFTINGISLAPQEQFVALGNEIINRRVEQTVEVLRIHLASGSVAKVPHDVVYGEDFIPFTAKTGLIELLVSPIRYLVMPNQRVYYIYLLTSLLLAMVAYIYYRRPRGPFSLKKCLAYCLPKSIYLHRSAKLDYWYYLINRILFPLLFSPILLSSDVVSKEIRVFLRKFWDVHYSYPTGLLSSLLYTAILVIAFDFGLYVAHYLLHKVPALWEFHKVHHSAEVLTPITVYRQHPVDDFLAVTCSSLAMGSIDGVFRFLFPDGVGSFTVFQLNLFTFLFYVFGYNLRHSHVWLSYGPFWSSIFISPAQHQIHHSTAPKHYDKNIGFMLAIWDKLFGTIYIPKEKEEIEFGLPKEDVEALNTITKLYTVPFLKALKRIDMRSNDRKNP